MNKYKHHISVFCITKLINQEHMAMLSIYLSYSNLGNYLSWFTGSVPFMKLHEHKVSAGKRKETENFNDVQTTRRHGSGGCWQSPPQDVMEGILQKTGLIARTRLAKVCMSWSSFAMRGDLRCALQLPWLVHPQTPNTNYLTFSSLSEGEVVNLELPNPKGFRGHGKFEFLASSKGWLILIQEKGLNFDIFLYNPISRAQHQLPSLDSTIPSFPPFRAATISSKRNSFNNYVDDFVTKVVLSSPNISQCIVAAVFNQKILGLCRPGDKSWTVFEILNDEDDFFMDLLFFRGMLYGLVDKTANRNITKNCIGAARPLNFGDDQKMKVEFKVVYEHNVNSNFPSITEDYDDHKILISTDYNSYLVEPTTNSDKEILLIRQMLDCMMDCDDDDQVVWDIEYQRTRGFEVYKIDLESGKFHEVRNLGDQIIFLAEHSCSLFFTASDFELQANCIYFATRGYIPYRQSHKTLMSSPNISREIGIFSFVDGKIKRPIPSVDIGNPSTCKLSWFSPSI